MEFNTGAGDSNLSALRAMNERRQQWMAEKPQWDGNSTELRIRSGDLTIFQFAATGDDGDKFLKIYRSHIIPRQSKDGGRYNETRYCPVQSGDTDIPCPLCAQGHTDIKERMSMWLYVLNILHGSLPQKMPEGKTFAGVNYQGKSYYNEEVKGFKIWHTSAWRDSPWSDILKNAEIYKGLHNFTANLEVIGTGTSTRYKFYALPNSEFFPQELYVKAQEECQPIPDILRAQISSAVVANPQVATPQTQLQRPMPDNNIVFQPFALPGTSLPTLQIPGLGENVPMPSNDLPRQPEEDDKLPQKALF